MSELVIVGVSAVIAVVLPLMIYKLIVSYIDKKSKKNKSLYKFDFISKCCNASGITLTRWQIIRMFILFLLNPEELQIKITKINNFQIFQNHTWEYDEEKNDYILKAMEE